MAQLIRHRYVQALCINAAAATLSPAQASTFFVSSFSGTFLGPTLTTQQVSLSCNVIRSTRSFHTVLVTALQPNPKDASKQRATFHATIDFHVQEPHSFVYSAAPRLNYTSPEKAGDYKDYIARRISEGSMDESVRDMFGSVFGSFEWVVQRRECPEGMAAQNLFGLAEGAKTTQDHLRLTEKSSSWWVKSTIAFNKQMHPDGSALHMAALAFFLDGATSFIPLTHTGRFFDGVSACSSLDVNMRILDRDFRMDEWVLIELVTEGGGMGRTVPVARAWKREGNREGGDLRLIAISTQSCILRMDTAKEVKL